MPAFRIVLLGLLAALSTALLPWGAKAPATASSFNSVQQHAEALPTLDNPDSGKTAPSKVVLKALSDWIKAWRKQRILVFVNPRSPQGASVAKPGTLLRKYKLEPPGLLGEMTTRRELETLLDLCVALDSMEAAATMVQFAGLGLDGGRYTASQAPHSVREIAQKVIGKFTSTEAKQFILDVARGEEKVGRRREIAGNRAGAIQALGQFEDEVFRPAIESGLTSEDPAVRRAAAQGLAARPDPKSVRPLIDALAKEALGSNLMLLVATLEDCMESAKDGVTQSERRLAVEAAISVLGKTGWRGDMMLVEFLGRFRSAEAVPALIRVLEWFVDADDKIRSGELSTILQYSAHDTLVSITGALYPIDKPEQWREFWEREKDGFEISEPKEAKTSSKTRGAFFGIPVKGSRIVFILDLSGSMEVPADMRDYEDIPGVDRPTRWDQAKQQVQQAVERLPEVAYFNVVRFSTDSDLWQKNLQPAKPKVKRAFSVWLDKQRPGGGTNLWEALERGLAMQGFAGEDRFDTPVDEIFVVSDGAPSFGEVVEPDEILQLVQESNRFAKIRINTIFIDSPIPKNIQMNTPSYTISPEEMMKRLAEQNSGTFKQIGKPN